MPSVWAAPFPWDVTSIERFKKAVSAAGGIGQHGEKGFLDAVLAGLGYEGDDGPSRRQVQEKLRRVKNAAAETPEAAEERRSVDAERAVVARRRKRLRALRSEEEVKLDEAREESEREAKQAEVLKVLKEAKLVEAAKAEQAKQPPWLKAALAKVRATLELMVTEAKAADEAGRSWSLMQGLTVLRDGLGWNLAQIPHGRTLSVARLLLSLKPKKCDISMLEYHSTTPTLSKCIQQSVSVLLTEAQLGYRPPSSAWRPSPSVAFLEEPSRQWLDFMQELEPFCDGQADQPRLTMVLDRASSTAFSTEEIPVLGRVRLRALRSMRRVLLMDTEYKPMFGVLNPHTGGYKRWWQVSMRLWDLETKTVVDSWCWTEECTGTWRAHCMLSKCPVLAEGRARSLKSQPAPAQEPHCEAPPKSPSVPLAAQVTTQAALPRRTSRR